MREQLRHLIEMSDWWNVRLQITPFSFGEHSGGAGAFSVLGFPYPELSDIVYVEQMTSAIFLDGPVDVAQYVRAMSELQQDSVDARESRDLLRGPLQLSRG